eukprot:7377001-Prymnesium_polylepis.1
MTYDVWRMIQNNLPYVWRDCTTGAARGARLRRPRATGPGRLPSARERHATHMGMQRPAQRARAATRRSKVTAVLCNKVADRLQRRVGGSCASNACTQS